MTRVKEVAVKETSVPTLPAELMGSWDSDAVEAKDIRIPRALLMQAMSVLVGERKASPGDVVNSITAEKLADEKTPLKVVPIVTHKTWTVQEKVNGKFEFKRTEPYTPTNSNRPREEVLNGVETQNVETINLLCMLAEDLEKADALPIMISFRMTSYAAGKDLLTLKTNCQRINKPFPFYTVTLSPEYVKNDKGQYFVYKYAGAQPTADFEKHAVTLKTWHDTFKMGAAKIDEEVAEASATTTEAERF